MGGPAEVFSIGRGSVPGFSRVGLFELREVLGEGATSRVHRARHLTLGRVRVFSVRKAGRSVANLELALRPDDATMPGIVQLRGPRNRRVSTHVWQAVHAWLGSQPFRAVTGAPTDPACAESTLRALWRPYLNALASAGAGGGQIVPPEVGRSLRLGGPNPAKAATSLGRSP